MNILLAGGTGFLGNALIRNLTNDGHTVTVLSRSEKASSNRFVSYRKWNGKQMPLAIGLYDVVINLVGASIAAAKWTPEYKKELLESRLAATRACVEYINNCNRKPTLFINSSATGFYGGNREEEVTEDSVAGNDFMAELCQAWEKAASDASCRTVILRTGVILGKAGGIIQELYGVYNLGLGGKMAGGAQGFSWMHLSDWVKAVRFCMEKEELQGVMNLVAPKWATQGDFSKAFAKALGRPHFLFVPKFALDIMLGERSILVWGGQKILPKKLLAAGFEFEYGDLSKALQEIVGA